MRTSRRWLLTVLALGLATSGGLAGQEASLVLSGDPAALVVRTAVAGFQPDPVADEGTTYALVAVELSTIQAQLDAPLPAGVTMRLRMEPPPGAVSAGTVTLTTLPQPLVTSIPAGTYSGLGIRYELDATVSAGVVPLGMRQVLFTITTGP